MLDYSNLDRHRFPVHQNTMSGLGTINFELRTTFLNRLASEFRLDLRFEHRLLLLFRRSQP